MCFCALIIYLPSETQHMKQKQLLKKILSKTGLLRFAKMLQMGALSADSISSYIHKNDPECDHTVVHDFAG